MRSLLMKSEEGFLEMQSLEDDGARDGHGLH